MVNEVVVTPSVLVYLVVLVLELEVEEILLELVEELLLELLMTEELAVVVDDIIPPSSQLSHIGEA